MNPIGAALLACAALGCAWSAWVSLRGTWRLVVIVLSAALAVLVPVAQLDASTVTSEHASTAPSAPVVEQEAPPTPAVEAPVLPEVTDGEVETLAPPVLVDLPVAPRAAEAMRIRSDGETPPAENDTMPAPSDVPAPPEAHGDATRAAATIVTAPAAVEAPVELTAQAVVPSPAPSDQKHKKTPPGHERPEKAKPASSARSRRH